MSDSNITTIYSGSFGDCNQLTSVQFPATLTSIEAYAFLNCTRLTSIDFPYEDGKQKSNLKSIGVSAFRNAGSGSTSGLFLGNLPNSLETIGETAFSGAKLKGMLVLPIGLTSIGKNAFKGCSNIDSIEVQTTKLNPASGDYIFVGTTFTLAAFMNRGGNIQTKVPGYLLEGCTYIEDVWIEDTVTEIGANAFASCSSLKQIETVQKDGSRPATFPSGLKNIGDYAFYNCSSFNMELSFPDSLETIGAYAFNGCTATNTTLVIPEKVKSIGEKAFKSAAFRFVNVQSAAIGNNNVQVFEACPNIKSVRFSSIKLKTIPNRFCYELTSLETVILSVGVQEIGDFAFCNCTNLKKVSMYGDTLNMPSTLKKIGNYAFKACSKLEEIHLPDGLTTIGEQAFIGCTHLTKVYSTSSQSMPQGLTSIGDYAFQQCSLMEEIILPSGLTNLGKYAFYGCDKLNNIYFIENINQISVGLYAFMNVASNYSCHVNFHVIEGSPIDTYIKSIDEGGSLVPIMVYNDQPRYTINYVGLGADAVNSNPADYEYTDAITLVNPTREGFTFQGWYADSKYKTKASPIAKYSRGTKTFYAKWKMHKYTIKFNANGGKGTVKQMNCNGCQEYTLRANKFKKKGYTFDGWSTSKNGALAYANQYTGKNFSKKDGGKVTLYARWKPIQYTITYNLNGGTNNEINTNNYSSYYVYTKTFKFKKPVRAGYTFKGWYTNAKCTKKITGIKKGTTGNKTLYAKWSANKYWVVFNANGAGGSTAQQKGTYSDAVGSATLSACTYAHSDPSKTFAGWNTKADGTGTMYQPGDSLASFAKSSKYKKVTLYAIWN